MKKQPLKVEVALNTDKLQLKLSAIAKHAEALAVELDAIDNAWQCDCGSIEYLDSVLYENNEITHNVRECKQCHEQYSIPNDELPTHLEGSE